MEQCPVCGRSYGVTHDCPGPPAAESLALQRWLPPEGFSPFHYIRQALAISRLDYGAVAAASRDRGALFYGGFIWLVGQVLMLTGSFWTGGARTASLSWVALLLGLELGILLDAVLMLAQYGLCHLFARWWFGARGTLAGLLRSLLLGSVVLWVAVIPYIGFLIASLWSIAVMMIVFEEVDGIGRLQAFGLSFVIGIFFQAISRALLFQH